MSVADLLCAHASVDSALHLALELGMKYAELQHVPQKVDDAATNLPLTCDCLMRT